MFGLYATTSLAALTFSNGFAAAKDPSSLKTSLTPTGAERAGNADGSIPAWTGGMTSLPAGLKPNDYVPELFPDEKPVVVINAGNMAAHADRLSEGVMAMMTKYGFSIQVYPTHRTAAAPQYVYDNIAQNVTRAALSPAGGRLGFTGGFGGIPFPIPDLDNPLDAGAQIIWNHLCSYRGHAYQTDSTGYAVSGGQPILVYDSTQRYSWPFYDPNGSPESFNGILQMQNDRYTAPDNLVGQALTVWQYTNPGKQPTQAWELLNGQGRVRRSPEVSFDTPASQSDDIVGYDEYWALNGSPEKYDWKYLEKKEMYIPYNNNRLLAGPGKDAHLTHFLNPDLVRWELHRCWVIEGTLHPGERNVLARRRFYIDEDTWVVGVGDMWDSNNNLFKVNMMYNNCRPDLPGTVYAQDSINNLQTDDYVSNAGSWNQAKNPNIVFVDSFPASIFDPNSMAASSQY